MSRVSLWVFTAAVVLFASCESSNILVLFPFPAHSHFTLGLQLVKGLAAKGHQITFVNPFPQKTPIKNVKDVPVTELNEFVDEQRKILFSLEKAGAIQNMLMVHSMMKTTTEMTFQSAAFQKVLHSGEKFDAVIVEYFMNDAMVAVGAHFKCPTIVLAATGPSIITNHLTANPAPSSYVPNLAATFTKHMTFWERLLNLILNRFMDGVREFFTLPTQRAIFEKYCKSDVSFDVALHNISLVLHNSHVSVNNAVPRVPSIVEIGGFHVAPPQKLPDDIRTFLDGARDGVVLFSMGSNLKSKDLKPEVRADILKAFSKIKQKVLWKFEADIPDLPANVKVMKWLPQNDILAHPNVRAFISHGGLLSTIETIYHGVPVIGIPVFGDQKSNIASAVNNGYALSIPLPEISEEKLSWALNEILNDPKYRENAKQRSRIMHDQPLKPLDAATYWVEYVIRYRGAPQLRNGGVDLTAIQRSMLDIILFLTLVTVVLFVIFYIIIRKLLGLCFGRKKAAVSKTKKKN